LFSSGQRVESSQPENQEAGRWFRLIPATARRTIQSLDEIVWAINPRHDSLESLANYISQFAHEHMALAGIRCILDVPAIAPSLTLSAEVVTSSSSQPARPSKMLRPMPLPPKPA
jgi:hypothetical protein